MKKVLLILAIISSIGTYAQDQIITIDSDTLNCTITENQNGFVHFTFAGKDSTQVFKSKMSLDKIQSIKSETFSENGQENADKEDYPRTWIKFEAGYSRRLAQIPSYALPSQKDYYNELRNGYCLGASFTYFLNKNGGLGFKYALHRSKASDVVEVGTIGYMPLYDEVTDNIYINYIALSYTIRFLSENTHNAGFFRGSVGLVNYRNAAFIPESVQIKAKTIGFAFDLGYDIALSKTSAVSFGIGVNTGYYEKYTLTYSNGTGSNKDSQQELESGKGDNLAQLNLTIGLVFK